MDKITYLKLKEERKSESKSFQKETFCYRCFKQAKNCLCQLIVPFDSGFEFVFLMHPMEAKKEKMGTGRLTHSFLKNSKLIIGVDFTHNAEVNALISENVCYVMYPGEDAINVSSGDVSKIEIHQEKNQKIVIFLIDGTWPCAKKMMKLSSNLHLLPRISFDVTQESIFEIKEQPSKFCLSTIESIHLFLSECEKKNLIKLNSSHDKMIEVFKEMIEYQKKCASDPSLNTYRRKSVGYKPKEERTTSKKWESRSIIYNGNNN
jgi:DTW domain-containing protein YfiP